MKKRFKFFSTTANSVFVFFSIFFFQKQLLQELFQRQQGFPTLDLHYETSKARCQTMSSTKSHPSSPAKTGRVYASVAEMKRKGKVRKV